MDCENCHQRLAQIHLTQIVNDSVNTLHLCEECAAEKGVQTGAGVVKFPLGDFIASIGKGAASALPADADAGHCKSCESTLQDFREAGRLGCPACYESFDNQLKDLLRKLHGSNQHVGEIYRFDSDEPGNGDQIIELRQQLHRAIEAENFELAAELRDRIRVME
uniref:UVR domain-containing protein n=1 Tax=uncultured bacterium W5-51b TaxID=1130999 RepID=H9BX58_9BACT|nr:hypothetical protein [uncultured bacterium W5-51b]